MRITNTMHTTIQQGLTRGKSREALAKAASRGQNLRTDSLSISQQAREAADEKLRALEQLKANRKETEGMADEFAKKRACQTIALRLMNGDKVPFKDLQYLQKHDPALYQHALIFKRSNPKPQEHKSAVKEREQSDDGAQGDAPTPDNIQAVAGRPVADTAAQGEGAGP